MKLSIDIEHWPRQWLVGSVPEMHYYGKLDPLVMEKEEKDKSRKHVEGNK